MNIAHERKPANLGWLADASSSPKASATRCLAAVLLAFDLAGPTNADVTLEEPNLSGTVGLTGVAFGSGSVNASWSGGSASAQLLNGDNTFALRVPPGSQFTLYTHLNSFQNTSNAYFYHYLYNLPALGPDEVRTLDLTREAGRIRGTVDVVAGAVQRLSMQAYVAPATNESYSGSVSATAPPFEAVQPMPAVPSVRVRGSATLSADAGCNVPVSLSEQYVDVPLGDVADVTWSFDLSSEHCDLGSITGDVTLTGLDGANGDVSLRYHRVNASGPVSRYATLYEDGAYLFSDLNEGNYYVSLTSYLNAPYSYVSFRSAPVSVARGEVSTQDLLKAAGTVHGVLELNGAWDATSASSIYGYLSGVGGGAQDSVDRTTGALDFVAPVGDSYLARWYAYFYAYAAGRATSQSYRHFYYQADNSPIQVSLAQGDRIDVETLSVETSEALQEFHIANPEVGIKRLRIIGNAYTRDPQTNASLEGKYIDLTSSLSSAGVPTNSVSVLIRGEPGTYQLTATGEGDDGGTYSAPFELVLGEPQNTPVGTNVEQPFATDSGEPIGSVTFGSVSGAGDTTISLSSSGPQAPSNFKVFGGGLSQFYDIRTTAQFDQALVCLEYDDTDFDGNDSLEATLELAHYVCDADGASCDWEMITAEGSPDIATNTICGEVTGFSIFAMVEPLDGDGDGVSDAEDNCPLTANAGQEDLDGDGDGDACDTDVDGDGINDDADTCPLYPSDNNADLDGDGQGDVCDPDDDGDGALDVSDNCPRNANAGQADFDSDGNGDACDSDDDNDGIEDAQDECAGTPPGTAVIDAQGCSSAQLFDRACPPEADYRNHGKYVSCVAKEGERQLAEGLISEAQKDAAVSTAAQSEVGTK